MARELRNDPQLKDVQIWVVLRKGRMSQIDSLVARRPLPLLADSKEVDFERLYGMASAKAHLLFDRNGCLAPVATESSSQLRKHPELILPSLRELVALK